MSTQIVDSENVVDSLEGAPDKLRAEIGKYYLLRDPGYLFAENFSSGKIKTARIEHQLPNDQVLIPIKKATITIEGEEHVFRDHVQWNEYISQTIAENRQFLDHTFSFTQPTVTNQFIKNFHHPEYEDNTKIYPSNQLLNYNLISYPWDSQKVKDIGYLRTQFELPTNLVSSSALLNEFPNRIANYTGSIEEISLKQRHIFDLDFQVNNKRPTEFPYIYYSHKSEIVSTLNGFASLLIKYKKSKNLFQSIKKDLSFSLRTFNIGRNQAQAKVYNAISLLTSTSLVRFSEATDELFLLPAAETNHSDPSERFVNQLNAVRFLADMRRQVDQNSRDIEQIYNNINCESFLLGYKIEKYLDNTATQPIQTYYTIENNLIDTQIKYGRRYIYKTKVLVGIFGSSYSYTNLQVAQSEADPESPTSEKYWATVDVECKPSFQILEYEIDSHEVAFIDTPMLTPHATLYGRKDKPFVNFMLQPRFFTLGDFGQEDLAPVGNLRPSDNRIAELYELSGDLRASPDYFTGIYEVYRLDAPPMTKEDFANGFLTTIDESVDVGNLDKNIPIDRWGIDYARFTDTIIPNKKYYYAFRSLTYHGTPSQLTEPIEVELQQDSDEFKIVSKHYSYPQQNTHTYNKKAKRLIKITPNIERLLFSEEENKDNWELDEGELVSYDGSGKAFKIRITSKHTGKKMDLNITFKLNKDDTFNLT